MTANLLIGYPDIPYRATSQTLNKTADTEYPSANLIGGPRTKKFQLSTATADDLWMNYVSSGSAEFFALLNAKELKARGCQRISLRGASQSALTPSSVTGRRLHLDASQGVTYDSATMQVSAWADQSGVGNNASQGTAASRPLLTRADNKGNLTLRSRTPASWTQTRLTATNDYATNYDGTATAGRLLADSTTGQRYMNLSTSSWVGRAARAGMSYTFDYFLKYSNHVYSWVGDGGDSAWHGCNVNLQTGTIQTTTSLTSSSITSLGSGWYRVRITFTRTDSGSFDQYVAMSVSGQTSGASSGWLANGTQEILFGGVSARGASWDTDDITTTTIPQIAGINGLRVLAFDGANDYLSANGLATSLTGDDIAFTALVVARVPNNASTYTYFSAGNSGAANPKLSAATKATGILRVERTDSAGSTVGNDTAGTAITTSTQVHSIVFSGTTISAWVDGTNFLNAVAHNVGSLSLNIATIGALGSTAFSNYFTGDICEVIIFNSALGTTDRQAIEAYLTAKWVTAPTYKNLTFASETLLGPRAEDFITTFSASSTFANWWVQMSNDSTHKYGHAKHFFGRFFDFGRDPEKPLTIRRARATPNARDAAYYFTLEWKGITAAKAQSFIDTIFKYRDVFPVILYDAADVVLHDNRLLYCTITGGRLVPVSSSTWNISLDFEELT